MPANQAAHTTPPIDLSQFHLGATVYWEAEPPISGGRPGNIIRGVIYELRTVKFLRSGMSTNGSDYIALMTDVHNLTTNQPYTGMNAVRVSLDRLYRDQNSLLTDIAIRNKKG